MVTERTQRATEAGFPKFVFAADVTATRKPVEYFPAFANCHLSRLSLYLLRHCKKRQAVGMIEINGLTHL